MEQAVIQQLDLFDGCLSVEWIHGEKIRKLEDQQNNLRKGLFRRWKEQEGKIQTLSESLSQVLKLLEKECNDG
jgi:hypothetical protein